VVQQLDLGLLLRFNDFAGRWPFVDGLARLLVNDYLMPTALASLLVWLWLRGRGPRERALDTATALNAFASQFVANLVLKTINLTYFRPRPFDHYPQVHLLFYRPWDSSCPSNPATFGFALAVAIYLGDRKLGRLALALASLWVVARVFCGVHYPLDVAAGSLLGGSVAYYLSRRSQTMAWLREHLLVLLRKGLMA
jgi:undecaprenyl-diphosphatase